MQGYSKAALFSTISFSFCSAAVPTANAVIPIANKKPSTLWCSAANECITFTACKMCQMSVTTCSWL